jgi:hypothetical protein
VYVYRHNDGQWTLEAVLVASDAAERDVFGRGLGLYGDCLIVGAPGDDDGGDSSGSAYVFRHIDGVWTQESKLVHPGARERDYMGWTISVLPDLALISAHGDEFGDPGAALIFRNGTEGWSFEAELVGDGLERDDRFGFGAALGAPDVAVVGAYNNNNENGNQAGVAFIFRFDGESWNQEARLLPGDSTPCCQLFGFSAAMAADGEMALIGALHDDEAGHESGSVYLFAHEDGEWTELMEVVGSQTGAGDQFGVTVAASGDRTVIGAVSQSGTSGDAYIFAGLARLDCNTNGEPDSCDVHLGSSRDSNENGIPDECDADLDSDGDVDIADLLLLLAAWGPCGTPCSECVGDVDGDCNVSFFDLVLLLSNWGRTSTGEMRGLANPGSYHLPDGRALDRVGLATPPSRGRTRHATTIIATRGRSRRGGHDGRGSSRRPVRDGASAEP